MHERERGRKRADGQGGVCILRAKLYRERPRISNIPQLIIINHPRETAYVYVCVCVRTAGRRAIVSATGLHFSKDARARARI